MFRIIIIIIIIIIINITTNNGPSGKGLAPLKHVARCLIPGSCV
jgi:hypothetical protein